MSQTPATTRTASFSEPRTSNDVTPAKKSKAGLPAGNYHGSTRLSMASYQQDSICTQHTSAFFISLIPAFCICPFLHSNATTAVLLFKFSFYFSLLLLLLLRPLVVLLSAHLHLFFMLVSLRLSSFYTVASEECGHRRLER